jgi:hypothetical protein
LIILATDLTRTDIHDYHAKRKGNLDTSFERQHWEFCFGALGC